MTPAEIEVKINIARREMQYWQETLSNKGCKDCKNWQHLSGGCGLADGANPPVEIIKAGCPSWEWDSIPF